MSTEKKLCNDAEKNIVVATTDSKYINTPDLSNVFVQQVDTVVELVFLFTFPKQRKSATIYN